MIICNLSHICCFSLNFITWTKIGSLVFKWIHFVSRIFYYCIYVNWTRSILPCILYNIHYIYIYDEAYHIWSLGDICCLTVIDIYLLFMTHLHPHYQSHQALHEMNSLLKYDFIRWCFSMSWSDSLFSVFLYKFQFKLIKTWIFFLNE